MILIIRWKEYGASISFSLLTERSSSKIGSCLMSTTVRTGGLNGLNAGTGAFKDRLDALNAGADVLDNRSGGNSGNLNPLNAGAGAFEDCLDALNAGTDAFDDRSSEKSG